MTSPAHNSRRALVDLLPQYLMRRLRGWTQFPSILKEAGLAGLVGPSRMVLRAIALETEPGGGRAEAELGANLCSPYAPLDWGLEALPRLVGRSCLALDGESYIVAPLGRALVERLERAGRAYLTTLDLLPPADLARLADTF